jgi:hypothetical protein
MNRLFVMAVAVCACGGSSGKDLSNFTGAAWNGALTTTVTCGTQTQTQNSTESLAFTAVNDADFQYQSQAGCLFKFIVSGTTANLSNGPVTCSSTVNAGVVTITFTSYQISTSDGHHLTSVAAGTATAIGQTCSLQLTGSGTR